MIQNRFNPIATNKVPYTNYSFIFIYSVSNRNESFLNEMELASYSKGWEVWYLFNGFGKVAICNHFRIKITQIIKARM